MTAWNRNDLMYKNHTKYGSTENEYIYTYIYMSRAIVQVQQTMKTASSDEELASHLELKKQGPKRPHKHEDPNLVYSYGIE